MFRFSPKKKLIEELTKSQNIFFHLIDEKEIEENVEKIVEDINELIVNIENMSIDKVENFVKNMINEGKPINNGVEWYIIYSKLAKALNQFYNKFGDKSGEKLFEKYKELDSQYEILSWVKHFNEYNVSSLDPIHIFASFTYWNIPLNTRKRKMLFFCKLFKSFDIDTNELEEDINKSIDSNYLYFPHPNITYMVSARNHKTQKEVWEFFGLIYKNIDNERLEYLFSHINANWYGVKIEFATIFMFWVDSENFISLDKNTFTFLKQKDKLNKLPMEYHEYKKLIEGSNEFLSLYRNIVKIADNESFINELTDNDKVDYDRFLIQK